LFYQNNCQKFLVLQVNLKIYQDSKSLLKHREASTRCTATLIWGLRQIYSRKTKWKKKKTSKRSTTLEVKTSGFYWSQWSGDVSPTPSTCQVEEFLNWDGQIEPVILGGLHWLQVDGILLYHGPSVNVSNLGCDPLSTSDQWFLTIRFPDSTLGSHKFTCVLWWFLSGFWLLR
jgi:hypothetical protein